MSSPPEFRADNLYNFTQYLLELYQTNKKTLS